MDRGLWNEVREFIKGAIEENGPLRTRDVLDLMDGRLVQKIYDKTNEAPGKFLTAIIVKMRRAGELFAVRKGAGGVSYYGTRRHLDESPAMTTDERLDHAFKKIAELQNRIEQLEQCVSERL